MINWETIKSLYNDKPTLLQWLKKVEAALAASVLQVVDVEKVSTSEIKFNFVFEDGTNIETPTIALPYEIQNAAIVNGHLILTLESGETLDAGNLGAVSGFSIDAAQHLIVTYQDGTTQDLGAIFQGNVNISGNLSVSGSIKTPSLNTDEDEIRARKPIVEVMDGYSFAATAAGAGLTMDLNYVGVAKNGNKLTIVLALDLTRTGAIGSSQRIGVLTIPESVADKLIPSSIGSGLYLDMKLAQAFYDESHEPASIVYFCNKATSTTISFNLKIQGLSALTQDVKHTIRLEQTFLLSENLAA